MSTRYSYQDLYTFTIDVLLQLNMERDIAAVLAETLVEGDLTGHITHGLQLLLPYVKEIEAGNMRTAGGPEVLSDGGSQLFWNGNNLPGPFLIHSALDTAVERCHDHPVITVLITRSHHTAALIAYLKRVTDRNLMVTIMCSDPSVRSVAPFGGTEPVYTPNPIAVGIPTSSRPVLIDISTSSTANGVVSQYYKDKQPLPSQWLLDSGGEATDDPSVLFTDPPGTILPLGGMDLGYKGFALGLMVEAVTSALAGRGRAEHIETWGASVFLQVINPAGFGGVDRFLRESEYLRTICKDSNPIDPERPVRLPGERALEMREDQYHNGIRLDKTVVASLREVEERSGVKLPEPMP